MLNPEIAFRVGRRRSGTLCVMRRGAARASTVTVGDLHLDVTTKRCRLRGAEIRLTSKEFAVLECLARQPGRVVAKSEILDEVWERGYDGDVNIVEVYIGGLRRKLDVTGSPGRRTIETVRGAGYRVAGAHTSG